jgi:hypothetical protein
MALLLKLHVCVDFGDAVAPLDRAVDLVDFAWEEKPWIVGSFVFCAKLFNRAFFRLFFGVRTPSHNVPLVAKVFPSRPVCFCLDFAATKTRINERHAINRTLPATMPNPSVFACFLWLCNARPLGFPVGAGYSLTVITH